MPKIVFQSDCHIHPRVTLLIHVGLLSNLSTCERSLVKAFSDRGETGSLHPGLIRLLGFIK